jgi:hypothetical protein
MGVGGRGGGFGTRKDLKRKIDQSMSSRCWLWDGSAWKTILCISQPHVIVQNIWIIWWLFVQPHAVQRLPVRVCLSPPLGFWRLKRPMVISGRGIPIEAVILSLCRIKHGAMKVYGGLKLRFQLHVFFMSALDGGGKIKTRATFPPLVVEQPAGGGPRAGRWRTEKIAGNRTPNSSVVRPEV